MNFTHTPLYQKSSARIPRHIRWILTAAFVIAPLHVLGTQAPYEQEFIITSYYSPLPDQCCYVKGGLEADKILNGQGIAGADGTPVFPGMLAAPPTYAFGTKVTLNGLGTFTVHDRGGAIQELPDGVHRLDIWAGYGEEGLARALAFGVQRVKGTVYPVGSLQPVTEFVFDTIPVSLDRLKQYLVAKSNLVAVRPKEGDTSLSVQLLQEHLSDLGYLREAASGYFGPATKQALEAFQKDQNLDGDGSILDQKTGASIMAAVKRAAADKPISGFVDQASSEAANQEAQRTLRFLGYYDGRTDGQYRDELFNAILHFQQDHQLVGTAENPGAGRIGPITLKEIEHTWNRKLVALHAEKYLLLNHVAVTIASRGDSLQSFLEEGYGGDEVRTLQRLLVERNFFPEEEVNGYFGPLTRDAVIRYQLSMGLIKHSSDNGAGIVGPATLTALNQEEQLEHYKLVRGEGLRVL